MTEEQTNKKKTLYTYCFIKRRNWTDLKQKKERNGKVRARIKYEIEVKQ